MLEVRVLVLVLGMVLGVEGHGRLVDPPARSTMWRLGFDTPRHYNDHQLFCGGFTRQWVQNRGRCGVCGDPWDLPRPRPHEAGGTWGTGTISRVYREGQVLVATVQLTTNHMGWFEFRLCPNNDPGRYVKQRCLNKHVLQLLDYPGTRYRLKDPREGLFHIRLQLPSGLTCTQCVVQWHYTTGNNWGFCKDGSDQPGCGPQEVFRGCSDVAVFSRDDPSYYRFLNLTSQVDLSKFLHLKEKTLDHTSEEDLEEDGSFEEDLQEDGPLALDDGDFVDPFDTAADEEEDLINHGSQVKQRYHGDLNGRLDQIPHEGQEARAPPPASRAVGTHLVTSHSDAGPTTSRSITFLDNIKMDEYSNDLQLSTAPPSPHDQALRNPQHINKKQNSLLTSSSKNYVSSDEFRTLRIGKRRKISASTSFLPPSTDVYKKSGPVVIDSNDSGATLRSAGPSITLEGVRSPQSNQSPSAYHPLTRATARIDKGDSRIVPEGERSVRKREGRLVAAGGGTVPVVAPLAIRLVPRPLASVAGGLSPGKRPLLLQGSLESSLVGRGSLDQRLVLLQRALPLAPSTSTSTVDSPLLLIWF